eukprot:scaffold48963_cov22-Prasinocladus_malaysianus.AAC.1
MDSLTSNCISLWTCTDVSGQSGIQIQVYGTGTRTTVSVYSYSNLVPVGGKNKSLALRYE